jgi:hypothetical protein
MSELHDADRDEHLTRAPKSDESDADPRIDVTELPSGVTRIDVAPTAAVRPGEPTNVEHPLEEREDG